MYLPAECVDHNDRSWRSPAPCKHTRWVSWVRVMLSSIVQPVDHRVLDLVSGQRLDNLRDIPLHCGRPALVNIGSITRDRPALKKLRENGFQSFKTFSWSYLPIYLINIEEVHDPHSLFAALFRFWEDWNVYSNWSVSDILWWDGINLAMTSLGFMNTQHHIAYHSVLVFELVQALLRLHLIHPVKKFSGRRAKEWPLCWWTLVTKQPSLSPPPACSGPPSLTPWSASPPLSSRTSWSGRLPKSSSKWWASVRQKHSLNTSRK